MYQYETLESQCFVSDSIRNNSHCHKLAISWKMQIILGWIEKKNEENNNTKDVNKRRIDAFSRSAQMLISTAKIMRMGKWRSLCKYLLILTENHNKSVNGTASPLSILNVQISAEIRFYCLLSYQNSIISNQIK